MSNGRTGFSLDQAVKDKGWGKQRKIQKMFTKAAEKGEDVVEDLLEAITKKMDEGVEGFFKGPIGKGSKALLPLLNFLFPGLGTGTSVAAEALDTSTKHRQFKDLMNELGGMGHLPGWTRGSFLDDYVKDAISLSRTKGVAGLKQRQKISDITGSVSTVMSALPFLQGDKGGKKITEEAFKEEGQRIAKEAVQRQSDEGLLSTMAGSFEEQVAKRAKEETEELMRNALKERAAKA